MGLIKLFSTVTGLPSSPPAQGLEGFDSVWLSECSGRDRASHSAASADSFPPQEQHRQGMYLYIDIV